tara:strand:+ start:2931 stop:4250 length:1320 start_codon:yes stop_codon:yes gene_type:complete
MALFEPKKMTDEEAALYAAELAERSSEDLVAGLEPAGPQKMTNPHDLIPAGFSEPAPGRSMREKLIKQNLFGNFHWTLDNGGSLRFLFAFNTGLLRREFGQGPREWKAELVCRNLGGQKKYVSDTRAVPVKRLDVLNVEGGEEIYFFGGIDNKVSFRTQCEYEIKIYLSPPNTVNGKAIFSPEQRETELNQPGIGKARMADNAAIREANVKQYLHRFKPIEISSGVSIPDINLQENERISGFKNISVEDMLKFLQYGPENPKKYLIKQKKKRFLRLKRFKEINKFVQTATKNERKNLAGLNIGSGLEEEKDSYAAKAGIYEPKYVNMNTLLGTKPIEVEYLSEYSPDPYSQSPDATAEMWKILTEEALGLVGENTILARFKNPEDIVDNYFFIRAEGDPTFSEAGLTEEVMSTSMEEGALTSAAAAGLNVLGVTPSTGY